MQLKFIFATAYFSADSTFEEFIRYFKELGFIKKRKLLVTDFKELKRRKGVDLELELREFYWQLCLLPDPHILKKLEDAGLEKKYQLYFIHIDKLCFQLKLLEEKGVWVEKKQILFIVFLHFVIKIYDVFNKKYELYMPYNGKKKMRIAHVFATKLKRKRIKSLNPVFLSEGSIEDQLNLNVDIMRIADLTDNDPKMYDFIRTASTAKSEKLLLPDLKNHIHGSDLTQRDLYILLYSFIRTILPEKKFPETEADFFKRKGYDDKDFDAYKYFQVGKILQ